MPNKKKLFNKDNSVKFLLLHGNTQAINADGETLENVLVPVSKNYKPGTSLLMSNIGAISNANPPDEDEEEPDLKKIMDAFNDSDTEVVVEDLPSKMKHLHLSKTSKKSKLLPEEYDEDGDDFFEGQFSDISEDSYEDSEDDTDNDPNCPETIKMFNAKFKEVLKEYDDDQIGALDDEDICGYLDPYSNQFSDQNINNEEEVVIIGECDEELKEKILNYADDSGDEKIVEIVTEKPLEFDCESILSTYSNKYNHPTLIKEQKIKKIQIPNNPLKKRLTKSQLKTLPDDKQSDDNEDDDDVSVITAFNIRVKNETPEQKRERKREFKEAKRESRMLKKENKLAFKKEKKIQKSQHINAQRNAGIKLI